uniref:Uncharacterized protein n=1 Tax=Aegilops tauschii TaxID=37682 RepID=R7W3Y1_AEGTA
MEDGGVEFLLDAIDRFPLREEFADNLEHPDPVPPVLVAKQRSRPCRSYGLKYWIWLRSTARRPWE